MQVLNNDCMCPFMQFDQVSYQYPAQNEHVLTEVSFAYSTGISRHSRSG